MRGQPGGRRGAYGLKPMKRPRAEELQTIVAQGRLERAVAILQQLDPAVAADTMMSLPFEEQEVLFRRLPIGFAATLVPIFPYYHAFVLLYTLSTDQMNAVVEKMNPIERSLFLDELPEEAWGRITTALAKKPSPEGLEGERSTLARETRVDRSAVPVQPIIEARGIEKGFQRPGGGHIHGALDIVEGVVPSRAGAIGRAVLPNIPSALGQGR